MSAAGKFVLRPLSDIISDRDRYAKRLLKALREHHQVETVGDILRLTETDILMTPGLRHRSLWTVRVALRGIGLALEMGNERDFFFPPAVRALAVRIPVLIAAAEADGLTIDSNVIDLVMDNSSASIDEVRQAIYCAGLELRFPRALCKDRQTFVHNDGGCLACPAVAGEACRNV